MNTIDDFSLVCGIVLLNWNEIAEKAELSELYYENNGLAQRADESCNPQHRIVLRQCKFELQSSEKWDRLQLKNSRANRQSAMRQEP